MPKTPHAAKEAAKARMSVTGENFTTALRHVTTEHGGRTSVPTQSDVWDGFTAKERERGGWNEIKLTDLATRQELKLLGAVASELGWCMYHLDVLRWGDEPVILADPDDHDDRVLPRLPRCSDRMDQAWRARMARAFCDLASDLEAGKAPIARCHAEDLALMIAAQKVRELVESAKAMASDPLPVGAGETVLDAAGHIADWYPTVGRISFRRPGAFKYADLEETLLGSAEVYLLWNAEEGFECPDHPLGWQMMREDMRPDRWFDCFATTIPRDPDRGFPPDVWTGLTDHARQSLAREPIWLGQDDDDSEPVVLGETPLPVEILPGSVMAANFLVAAWRQQVLNLIGRTMRETHRVWHVEDPDQAWQVDGRAVLSDVPAVALAQLRRLLPGADNPGEGELVEIYWSRPAPAERYFSPRWFRVQVWKIEERSTGPLDVPWLRVRWADGTLSGMSLIDIVAIRRPTDSWLSPWTDESGDLLEKPTIQDYRQPDDDV